MVCFARQDLFVLIHNMSNKPKETDKRTKIGVRAAKARHTPPAKKDAHTTSVNLTE